MQLMQSILKIIAFYIMTQLQVDQKVYIMFQHKSLIQKYKKCVITLNNVACIAKLESSSTIVNIIDRTVEPLHTWKTFGRNTLHWYSNWQTSHRYTRISLSSLVLFLKVRYILQGLKTDLMQSVLSNFKVNRPRNLGIGGIFPFFVSFLLYVKF